ncbi:MAG: helix-turn-helix domain-containing protein [Candidatus Dormibacteraeota bacterium]|nr:helix-turn-helix domain-containing protein [Candidatus Dormibacteraeota bacterium]
MPYHERPTPVAGAVLWRRSVGSTPELARILPDGCLDLLWDGRRLFIAGPDTVARRHQSDAGASYVGLRFSGGSGPALLGVPADKVRDQTPNLAELWPARRARLLAEQVAENPEAALEAWLIERARSSEVDPLGPRVLGLAAAGTPIAVMAERLGLSPRHLYRRCLPIFGYGPRRLARVLRLSRAVGEVRLGLPLAQVAAGCGYVDQAHLSREMRALAKTTPGGLLREQVSEH